MSDRIMNPATRKAHRRLAPSEKYEVFVSPLTGQATQREAAEKWQAGRSTVRAADLPDREAGRAGRAVGVGAGAAGNDGRAGRAGAGEVRAGAAAGHGDRAGGRTAPAPGKSTLGLTAGPVPARVDACVKAGLPGLLDHAADQGGWPARQACALLGPGHMRAWRWQQRRTAGQLADLPPGGHPVHGLLARERAAIVELCEARGEIDRSHRKLAHRGSRLGLVHVSESTVARGAGGRGPGPARKPAA